MTVGGLMHTFLLIAATFFLPQQVEIADTPEERAWGLMGRTSLKENEGMLFIYPSPQHTSIWMFNIFNNLSVAFLDENGVITEIHTLNAFPEMMDPKRPVRKLEDLKKYPPNNPIVTFFRHNAIQSSKKVKYVLEMPAGWFKRNNIKIGDQALLQSFQK